MRKETELFVGSIVHEDRSVIDLLDAKYTFLNERLAKHYGIPGVYGSDFRRVELTPDFDMRRGLLGQASIETISSYPQRTTPTVRGKTIMQIFLGVESARSAAKRPAAEGSGHGRPWRREAHHAAADGNASQAMSPAPPATRSWTRSGSRWKTFDAVGHWRTTDNGSPIDANGTLVDGSKLDGVKGMRDALLDIRRNSFGWSPRSYLFTRWAGGPSITICP